MYNVRRGWTTAKKTNGYASKFEAGIAQDYKLLKAAKKIKDYREQVTIPLNVNGYHICNYIIDFIVEHLDGTNEYIEAKGYKFPVWVIKWKLFEAIMSVAEPTAKLTVIMQNSYGRIPHAKKLGRAKIFT